MMRIEDGMIDVFTMFGLLVAAHALADYPLQGDFLSKAKNRLTPIPGVPWYQALAAHSAIHAGFVGVITGNIGLAIAEFIAHAFIDDAKCSSHLTYNQDQALHILCKAIWVWIAIAWSLS